MEIGFSTIGNNLKTSFGIRKPEESEKSFDKAVDDLLDRTFPDKKQNIPECGDFAPVYVDIESPVDDPSIKNVRLQIEPSVYDSRTRKLSVITTIDEDDVSCSMLAAKGNNFAMKAVLKDKIGLFDLVKKTVENTMPAFEKD